MIRSGADWARFLLGFAVLLGVLLGTSELDASGRYGLAVLCTMPLVAVAHVPIVVRSGLLVGAAALLVAAVTAIPLAHLYDLGYGTIWAPALLHTAIDSFKLVDLPGTAQPTFSLLLAATSIVVPLLVLVRPPAVSLSTERSLT
jgi:hypothetical protein